MKREVAREKENKMEIHININSNRRSRKIEKNLRKRDLHLQSWTIAMHCNKSRVASLSFPYDNPSLDSINTSSMIIICS
jgi:hypothetical protein